MHDGEYPVCNRGLLLRARRPGLPHGPRAATCDGRNARHGCRTDAADRTLPAYRVNPPTVDRLREVLGDHPGTTEVHLRLQSSSRTTLLRLDDAYTVQRTAALMGDLKALLGASAVA
nr:hypothetical protein [Parafrankia colletiae]